MKEEQKKKKERKGQKKKKKESFDLRTAFVTRFDFCFNI